MRNELYRSEFMINIRFPHSEQAERKNVDINFSYEFTVCCPVAYILYDSTVSCSDNYKIVAPVVLCQEGRHS